MMTAARSRPPGPPRRDVIVVGASAGGVTAMRRLGAPQGPGLPAGLEFTAETGILAGTPTIAGTFNFSLGAGPTMDNPDCGTVPAFTQYEIVVNE